jgi:branched-chain amino acid transport system substrate-binding protein
MKRAGLDARWVHAVVGLGIALLVAGCPATGTGGSGDAGATSAESSGPIMVGEYGSLTGSEATFGKSTDDGVQLKVEEINNAGGVHGRKLQVRVEDDQSSQTEAATAVSKLIDRDRVVAVLGEVASGNSLAAAPFCQNRQVPMISPASTNPEVTRKGDYIFRVCFIDPFQGTVMAKFAAQNLKLKRVAIFKDQGAPYSTGLADNFRTAFTGLGGTIVAEESYTKDDTDFKAQLGAIKAKNPQAIFIPGYYTQVGTIGRQARDLGITVPLLGGDGWDSPKLFEGAGNALEGCYFSNHYSAEDKSPAIQSFIQAYKARYNGQIPDAMAALGYDAAGVLADAMKRAKSLSGPDLREAIAQTKDYPCVTGTITIDAERNARKPAVVLQVKGQGYKYVTTIQP